MMYNSLWQNKMWYKVGRAKLLSSKHLLNNYAKKITIKNHFWRTTSNNKNMRVLETDCTFFNLIFFFCSFARAKLNLTSESEYWTHLCKQARHTRVAITTLDVFSSAMLNTFLTARYRSVNKTRAPLVHIVSRQNINHSRKIANTCLFAAENKRTVHIWHCALHIWQGKLVKN